MKNQEIHYRVYLKRGYRSLCNTGRRRTDNATQVSCKECQKILADARRQVRSHGKNMSLLDFREEVDKLAARTTG